MAIWASSLSLRGGCWGHQAHRAIGPEGRTSSAPPTAHLPRSSGITSPSLLAKDISPHHVSKFLQIISSFPCPIPAQRDNIKRSQGLDARAKRETGVPGNKKSRTWLVRIRQEIDLWLTNRLPLQQTVCSPFRSAARPSCRQRQHVLAALKHFSSTDAMLINVTPASQISRGELRIGRKAVETTETRALVSPCHDIAPRPGEPGLFTRSQPRLSSPPA